MPINTPESATYKKSYPEKKKKKNRGKYLRKYRKYYEGNKERVQKWFVLVDVRQKEQDKKIGILVTDIRICLNNTNKK